MNARAGPRVGPFDSSPGTVRTRDGQLQRGVERRRSFLMQLHEWPHDRGSLARIVIGEGLPIRGFQALALMHRTVSSRTSVPTALALTSVLAAHPADAALLSYLSGALTQVDSPIVYFNTPPNPTPGVQSQFFQGNAAFSSQAFAGQVASASASIQSGTLRATTSYSGAPGQSGGVTVASAFIGDSYAYSGGQGGPFVWGPNGSVTFDITVDGFQSVLAPSDNVGEFGILALMIYQPGTLDDFLPFCGSNVMYSFFWSVGGNSSVPCGAFRGNLSGSIDTTVSASFNPGGDFAWALGFRAVNFVGGPLQGNVSWSNQFGNTIRYSVVNPEGAVVTTASGFRPGGEPEGSVPLPGSLALLGLGLAAMGAGRFRRTRAPSRP